MSSKLVTVKENRSKFTWQKNVTDSVTETVKYLSGRGSKWVLVLIFRLISLLYVEHSLYNFSHT